MKTETPKLTPGQAQYILTRAMQDGKIRNKDIERYRVSMQEEINSLEGRLNFLRAAVAPAAAGALAKVAKRVSHANGNGKKTTARRRRVSAEQRASQKVQGRYLGLIRQIPESKRGRFQKIASEKGREAAIKELQFALQAK